MRIEYNKRKVLDKIYVYDLLFKKVSGYQICIFIFQKSKFKKTKFLDITHSSIYNTYKCTFGGILTNARRKCVFFNKRI